MAKPDIAELAQTVARMEAALKAREDARATMAAYRAVSQRFAADLSDPRDVLVSRGGALMMTQALARNGGKSGAPFS